MTTAARLTHYGRACVLAELAGQIRVLFDPGTYSAGFEDLTGLDAILITHAHPDPTAPVLAEASPDALLVTADRQDDPVTAGGAAVRAHRGDQPSSTRT